MSTATLTSKGQITLPKEVREHFKLSEGDRIDFIVEDDGKVRVVPITGSFRDLLGICHRPGVKALTVEEMQEILEETAAEEDQRIREGREVEDWE
jgi:AbrB family looped-hinge helix DNA binding protein